MSEASSSDTWFAISGAAMLGAASGWALCEVADLPAYPTIPITTMLVTGGATWRLFQSSKTETITDARSGQSTTRVRGAPNPHGWSRNLALGYAAVPLTCVVAGLGLFMMFSRHGRGNDGSK